MLSYLSMDGTLYKWYGPFQRWQSRYCIINNGQLDIYASKEASKKNNNLLESHHIASANVNPSKTSDLEWTIQAPGKSVLHFKVDQVEERRNWLQLIGSAKACIANTSVLIKRRPSITSLSSINSQSNHVENSPKLCRSNLEKAETGKSVVSPIEDEITASEVVETNMETVGDSKVKNLDGCQALTVESLSSVCQDLQLELSKIQERCNSKNDDDTVRFLYFGKDRILELFSNFKIILHSISARSNMEEFHHDDHRESKGDCISDGPLDSGCSSDVSSSDGSEPQKFTLQTFFTTVEVSFADVMTEARSSPNPDLCCSIRSETYIAACIRYTRFFDLFAGTLLAPLKSDILSNSEKVRKAFAKNPSRYLFLQLIFEDEIKNKNHLHPDSATQAVLWMMRGLRTISTFIISAVSEDNPFYEDSPRALEAAYREHLRKYHNFVVQRMFTMGIKLVPSMEHFKKQVVMEEGRDLNSKIVENEIMKQAIVYCQAMKDVVRSVEKIYVLHKIEL